MYAPVSSTEKQLKQAVERVSVLYLHSDAANAEYLFARENLSANFFFGSLPLKYKTTPLHISAHQRTSPTLCTGIISLTEYTHTLTYRYLELFKFWWLLCGRYEKYPTRCRRCGSSNRRHVVTSECNKRILQQSVDRRLAKSQQLIRSVRLALLLTSNLSAVFFQPTRLAAKPHCFPSLLKLLFTSIGRPLKDVKSSLCDYAMQNILTMPSKWLPLRASWPVYGSQPFHMAAI